MKNVSTEFRKKVENGSACYAYANVVLRNGTKLTLDPSKDFRIDGNSITTNGGSSFPLGVALSRTIELNLDNYDGRFDAIDFYGAEITLFTGMTLDDGSVEKIKEGIFSVVEPTTPGSTITLVAADYMAKTSDSYVANTTFPATIFNIYRDVCIQCNLVAGSAKFTNGDFVVDAISENVTCREMLGYIAMIAGGNAMCDSNGAVIIKSYDFSGLKKSDGTYDYTKAQNFSGFQKNPSISTDMIRITGVKAENDDGDEKQSYIVGSEDYCFLIENPLISGKEAQALQLIGNVIVGLEFYTFSGDHISNPLAEFMDPCFVQDMKGNLFFSVLSNITYTYLGSTSISCDTDSPETVKSQKATSGSKVYQNLKKQQQVIKKEFEKQMDALEKQVSNAPGTYISSEVQPDGSSIYYLHDKPTLAESKSVFKITADTITASTDGGKTWNGGFSVDGVMIAKIMTAIGINFDWGVGGTLIIQDRNGKQTVYMDAETGEVRLSVVSLSIQGETVADIAEKKAESSLNDFTSNIYNPMISSLQKQIDGQIETFYYDYEPTLNNVPAKEWDTEEKKTAHEGDLFYWKSKGYAYRFQKDGSAWNWQLVQDTDITLAMQKAAEAKDTADSKRRVFTATPYPPYDVGDLWVGNDTSDLMRCQRSRQSGAYDSSDWIKAVKYTDDSELNNFIYTDYAETLVEISNSIDKKAETWFQATDPALQWTDNSTSEPLQDHTGANITDSTGANILTVWDREKAAHNGDLWHNTTNNVEYIYKDGTWHEMSVPDDVFDKIDGKAQIFVGEPIPPYDVGDTWFTGTTILVCVVKRTSGKYNASDWAKKDTYTDDTALENFLSGDYKETIADLSTQIDGKAETWRQSTDPAANWTTDELKAQHKGDLWNNTENQKTYIYNGSAWQEMTSTPPQAVFDAIDGKAQIFVKQPTTPYDVGDLWFDSSSADIMTCTTARESGNFNAADWEKRNKYTDDSSLNNWIKGDYAKTLKDVQTQIDGKSETWRQSTDPSKSWTTDALKKQHKGDLWYNTTEQKSYIYNGSAWEQMKAEPPSGVYDAIDGKAQIFVSQPKPPYSVGDLWVGNDTSDLMRCQRSRQSGAYDSSDWIKAVKYTDDSELNNFIYTDYAETLVEISNSIDKKAETWFQATDPALQWTDNSTSEPLQDHTGANITDSTGANILTVWDREKAAHNGDLWHNTTNNVEYIYKDGTWHEMSVPDDVFDKIDGKAQIFVGEPIPPYDVGDTWFTGTTILVCVVKRTSGKYNASDWAKKDTYTDDTALENFLSGDYKETIADLSTQIDGKAETWRQSTDPAANWTTDELKAQHKGDLWNNTENQKTYIYNGSAWQEMTSTPPQAVFDAIDGKAQIFVKQPTTPYDVGDLWFDSSSADIMTCTTARESGNFNAADWEKRNKYTDDSSLNNWIKGDYAKTLKDVQTQIDGKSETWRQSTDPSKSWTTDALKKQHKGDLWYNTTEQKSYIYNGSAWEQMKAEPPSGVYDAIDGKAQIFVSQPKPPYSVGDLWFDSTSADIMTCVTARESGSYVAGDWQKRNKYTDNSAVDALDKALTQLEIFNRLTNNGAAQGIFLKDGKLFLNFSYAQGGTLKLGGVNNGNGQVEVYDSSGNKIGSWNKDGFNLKKGSIYGTQIHLESQNDYIQGTVNGNEAVKISTGGVKVDSTANWGFGVTRKEYIFEMNPYIFPGVRLLDRSTGAGIGSTWTSGHFGMCYTDDLSGYSSVTDSLSNYGVYMKAGKEDANGGFYAIGNGLVKGSRVTAEGIYTSGTKNRIVNTENYGQRLQYCYEMPSPFFGDIGEAETDENGLCYVQIDDIFGETVLRNDKYNVFLQKEGCGDLWIEEKTADYFLVKGTPNLSFSWELKAKQADYTLERLEKNETPYEKEPELDYSEIGYQTYIDYVESKIIA